MTLSTLKSYLTGSSRCCIAKMLHTKSNEVTKVKQPELTHGQPN